MRPPSPGRIAWIERVTVEWAARATALRTEPAPSAAVRATVLDGIVAALRRELPTQPAAVAPDAAEIARLEAILARCTGPYLHPEWGIMINDAPFLDDVEHSLRCRVARMRGLPDPPLVRRRAAPAPAAPAAIVEPPIPPPEAAPFRAGPQLTLFEYTA